MKTTFRTLLTSGMILAFAWLFVLPDEQHGLRGADTPRVGSTEVALANAKADSWGNLKGQFVFEGTPPVMKNLSTGGKDSPTCQDGKIFEESLLVDPETKGIKNTLVFARKVSRVHDSFKADEKQEVVFDQKNCVFLSHVAALRTSQPLRIKNSDPIGHNSNISPVGDQGINPLLAGGTDMVHQFRRQQMTPVPVTCNIHPWMKAYILPRTDPYFAITSADGKFEIANLPAGEEIEFQLWHERAAGPQGALVAGKEWEKGRMKIKIPAGGAKDLGVIKLNASAFK